MTLTVIQRRLRHLKSVSILNVSLIKNFTEDVTLKIVPCFIIIEDIKGQPVYVSEIQTGSHIIIQFNEFPQLPHVMSSIHLKIIGKVPAHLLEYPTDDTWVTMAEYTVDFNQLFKISSSELEQRIDEVNVPIFEFFDGCFAMKNTMKPATEAIESVPSSKSFTYNSLLKLNKILEYVTQMRQELSETSKKMDSLVDQLPSNYNNEPIRKACDKLRKELDDKERKSTA